MRTIGVIGGSGLYEIEGLSAIERVRLDTPFGDPSDEYVVGRLGDARMVFLPRHGRGHRIAPHEINYRANLHGMKQLGVEWVISVSAVGSLREEIRPGDIVIVDQFFDRTKNRAATFFGDGVVGHVGFADPVCGALADVLHEVAEPLCAEKGARAHKGGTYVVMEGPQFSTRAESRIYRQWGADVIGMTNLPEAKLAREAELCYATVALSTDYDCWHEDEAAVSVAAVLEVIRKNVALARAIVKRAAERIPATSRTCACPRAAEFAIMTDRNAIPPAARERLQLLYGKYMGTP
ncbi:MAG: S-methyl-5'-thioadenosine phosphorylase [Myxococcales bacterium]|nr:S-methyl-5'-thioadenosine phosphorylase [Myxococcales bacterium]